MGTKSYQTPLTNPLQVPHTHKTSSQCQPFHLFFPRDVFFPHETFFFPTRQQGESKPNHDSSVALCRAACPFLQERLTPTINTTVLLHREMRRNCHVEPSESHSQHQPAMMSHHIHAWYRSNSSSHPRAWLLFGCLAVMSEKYVSACATPSAGKKLT